LSLSWQSEVRGAGLLHRDGAQFETIGQTPDGGRLQGATRFSRLTQGVLSIVVKRQVKNNQNK